MEDDKKLAPVEITALRFDDGSYGVQIEITGLRNEYEALACMRNMHSMFAIGLCSKDSVSKGCAQDDPHCGVGYGGHCERGCFE